LRTWRLVDMARLFKNQQKKGNALRIHLAHPSLLRPINIIQTSQMEEGSQQMHGFL
jgi:hypothetical protein